MPFLTSRKSLAPHRVSKRRSFLRRLGAAGCSLVLATSAVLAADGPPAEGPPTAEGPPVEGSPAAAPSSPSPTDPAAPEPVRELGIGDELKIQVDGQPDMSSSMYVADDGSITVALAGAVRVVGLSPSDAARRVEQALRAGQFLVNPHVTITVVEGLSQHISVLGRVVKPGRYPFQSNSSILDVMAAAGGLSADGSDSVYVIRRDPAGKETRIEVDLKGLTDPATPLPTIQLRSGDSIFVPEAPSFYIQGEVLAPNRYRLEPGMRVSQAIARAGGVTPRGSASRIEVQRKKPDGTPYSKSIRPTDEVQVGDILRVKESIF